MRPVPPDWRRILLTLPGGEARLNFARVSEMQVTGIPALTLICDSVDAEADRLRALGVAIEGGPDKAPWAAPVRWLTIRDSEGNLVLMESPAP